MKILIIFGHPSKKSFNRSLMLNYIKGAQAAKHKVEVLNLDELNLEPFLKNDYKKEIKLQGKLKEAQNLLKWADHLVFFFPIWWATPPALLKTFLEVSLQRKFAYQYKKPLFGKIPRWDKLLKGRTARIVATMGSPVPYYQLVLGEPAYKMMKADLEFCGIKPVRKNYFGSVEMSSKTKREAWLKESYLIGFKE